MHFNDSKISNIEKHISLATDLKIQFPPFKVNNHLSKFHLNRTVNEPGNTVLRKVRELEKWWRLAPRIRKVAPGGTILPSGSSCSAKNMKNNIFRESKHHTSLVWHLAAKLVPQVVPAVLGILQLFPCTCEPQFFPSFPWHANFHKFSRNPTSNYNYLYPQRIHYQFSELVQTSIILVTFNPKGFNFN